MIVIALTAVIAASCTLQLTRLLLPVVVNPDRHQQRRFASISGQCTMNLPNLFTPSVFTPAKSSLSLLTVSS